MSKIHASLKAAGLTLSSLPLGEEVRINHVDCPAGRDSTKRLYLNNRGKLVSWYCHNEGDGGVVGVSDGDKIKHEIRTGRTSSTTPNAIEVPIEERLGVCFDPYDAYFPELARIFLEQYLGHRWQEASFASGIRWSIDYNGLVYPMGKGAQIRKFYPHGMKKGPKYVTLKGLEHPAPLFPVCIDINKDTTKKYTYVITEDYLSALRISMVCGYYGVPIYGAHVSATAISRFCKEWISLWSGYPSDVIVWLDNDSDHIVAKAVSISRTFDLMVQSGCSVRMYTHKVEPKHLTYRELEDILGYITGV